MNQPAPLPSSHPLESFYAALYEPLKLRARAANTRRLYRTTLRGFDRFLRRAATLADLDDATVGRYLLACRTRGLSPYSVNKERFNLLALWRWAAKKGYVANWPDVEAENCPEHVPLAWSREELARLFAAIRQMPGTIGSIPAARWWEALHLLLWDSGERIAAMLGLAWDDLDLSGGWCLCRAENRKGQRRDRLYPLAADTIAALVAMPATGPLVFPWPWSRCLLWSRYAEVLKRAGLPFDRKSKFHRMRKSVASHARATGLNATELLDHADARTTTAYIDPRIVQSPHVATHLFRPDGEPPKAA
jgi:site-specific recombinase XerD